MFQKGENGEKEKGKRFSFLKKKLWNKVFETEEGHSVNIYENIWKGSHAKACHQTVSKPGGTGDTLNLYKEKYGK